MWVGGWVDWEEEKKAVGMSWCLHGLGGVEEEEAVGMSC